MSIGAPAGFRGTFREDAEACAVYAEAAGVGRLVPRAVAVPADADDLVTLVRWARTARVPLTARGAGSSMAGGALGDGVIVDLGALAAAPRVDAAARTVRVGPAVTRDALEAVAAPLGLTLPVDPSSSAFATLGGMCATNAAGARTVRHGAMRAWVRGLECVFEDGSRAWLRRGEPEVPAVPALERFLREVGPRAAAAPPDALRHAGVRKESSGYGLAAWRASGDLVDLIVGSEGTLALIVDVELALAPRPGATASLLAGFPSLDDASAAAADLAELGASAVELLDRSFLDIAASEGDELPLPAGFDAVLVMEAEAADAAQAAHVAGALADRCRRARASHVELALSAADELRLWHLRHAASPILNRLGPRLQSMQLIEDGCVPLDRFAEYVRGVRAALARADFPGVIFGHAGDGHAHVNALVDVSRPDWRSRAGSLLEDVTALVAALGGTLAGEHGDGRLRAPLLARTWPPAALELFAATKAAFDPLGILNSGVKVAAAGARPLEALKYDASLPPLPAAARAVLDEVVRERGWGRSRLAMLDAGAATPPPP